MHYPKPNIKAKNNQQGFTLIELMIVMVIVSLLMGTVGPLAMNSLDRAEAKQEMLSVKNWLRKISSRAFSTGQTHFVKFAGKNVVLFIDGQEQTPIENIDFEALFFPPQQLRFNKKGYVTPALLSGTYRKRPLTINLKKWVNNEDDINPLDSLPSTTTYE